MSNHQRIRTNGKKKNHNWKHHYLNHVGLVHCTVRSVLVRFYFNSVERVIWIFGCSMTSSTTAKTQKRTTQIITNCIRWRGIFTRSVSISVILCLSALLSLRLARESFISQNIFTLKRIQLVSNECVKHCDARRCDFSKIYSHTFIFFAQSKRIRTPRVCKLFSLFVFFLV